MEAKEQDKKLAYVRNVMTFRLVVAGLLTIPFLLFGKQLSILITGDPIFYYAFQISMITILLDTVNVLILTVLRFDFQSFRVAALTFAKLAMIGIFAYLVLSYVDQSLDSLMYSRLLSAFLILLVTTREVWKYLRPRFDFTIWKEILIYATPLVPASLAFWVIGLSNRFIVKFFEQDPLPIIGHLTTVLNFASVITLFTYGIQMAWRPYSMKLKERSDAKELFAKVYIIILALGLSAVLFITTISPWILPLGNVSRIFWRDYPYIGFFSLSSFLNFYYLIVTVGIFVEKKTSKVTKAFIIASVINLVLNVTLYPYFALWTFVISNNVTYLFVVVYLYSYSQSIYRIPVSSWKMVFLFVQAVIAMSFITYVQVMQLAWYWIIFSWLYFLASLFVIRIDRDFKLKAVK